MGNLFGGHKSKPKQESRVTDADRAVLQLKQQRDKLKQYQKKIHASLERERLLARQLLSEGQSAKSLFINWLRWKDDILIQTNEKLVSHLRDGYLRKMIT